MWNATILGYSNVEGTLTVSVEYSNGVKSFIRSVDASGSNYDAFQASIQNKLATLNANDDFVANISAPIVAGLMIESPAPAIKIVPSVIGI